MYGITNASLEMIYIGQTDNLRRRLSEHYNDNKLPLWQYAPKKFYYQIVEGGEAVRRKYEAKLLEEPGAPPCNKLGKAALFFPRAKVTSSRRAQ